MRNVFSIILYAIAGTLFYSVCAFGFIKEQQTGVKWGIMLGCAVLAIFILAGGLALRKFVNWKMHTGIIFLSSAGVIAFLVFSIACFFLDENLRTLMHADSFQHFSDYVTGGIVTASFAALGLLLLRSNKSHPGQVPMEDVRE
jgi:hypothetical protein